MSSSSRDATSQVQIQVQVQEPEPEPPLQAQPQSKLSVVESAVLGYKLLKTGFIGLSATIRSFIRHRGTAPPFAVDVYVPVMKGLREVFTKRELIALGMSETSSAGITTYCQKRGLQHRVDELDFGGAIHWVGPTKRSLRSSSSSSSSPTNPNPNTNTDKILLYVHGGGYATPISIPQISLSLSFSTHLRKNDPTNHNPNLAILEFTLLPHARFPTPLLQIVSALRKLLTEYGYPPSRIVLGGESSGGHLILALLSFLSHPHPHPHPYPYPYQGLADLDPIDLKGEDLAGVFIMSPLVNRGTEAPSYARNHARDFTDVAKIAASRAAWSPSPIPTAGGSGDDNDGNGDGSSVGGLQVLPRAYLDPLLADKGWWAGVPVKRVLITAGECEGMVDDCVAFGERLVQEATPGTEVTVVQCPFEVHASAIIEETFGLKGADGGSRKVTEAWLKAI